ncbi:PREDICTED: aspartyl protease APCB1 [Tarenaya hassleriana]|uniref:aspartyl protease APCB1 n=1 Tax=Tarenaya hassleriana TaxID=28532 RepID=UPI00053C3C60|nr:PREDICTED: aspartyl protease APCB1 [Tarenaya hassleriana]
MDPDTQEQQRNIHGVVIITLPPSDDPSKGKTITAFTLTDDYYPPQNPPENEANRRLEPDPLHQNPQSRSGLSDLSLGSARWVLGLLGISLLAVVVYCSVFSDTVMMFRVSEERDGEEGLRETTSFVFPVYHKLGARRIPDRNLSERIEEVVGVEKGNSVEVIDQEMVNPEKVNGIVSVTVDSSTIFPVSGNVYPDGLYYTRVLVGNRQDGNYFHLDVDTGSDLTWIQCDAPCTSCAKGANPLYKPRKDKIVSSMDSLCVEIQRNHMTQGHETGHQCDYEIEYADHSSSMGVLTADELHLKLQNGSLAKLDLVFGCGYDQQGLLLNTLLKTDGILGLSRAKISLPSQLARRGIIKNVIGHCLAPDLNDEGYIFMGSDLVPQRGMTWVPMLHHPRLEVYHTEVTKMSYGSSVLSLDGQNSRVGKVVFDTGSSYTYFPDRTYSELITSLEEVPELGLMLDESDTTLPICWRANFPIGSVSDVKQYFRPITLQLGSKWWIISRNLQIQPEDYLIISSKGNVCLGILDGSSVHGGTSIVLGDISLRGQLMVYDNEKRRIGWKRSDCVRPHEFSPFPFFDG